MLLSSATVDFNLFYDGAADIQIGASHNRVSDTQVTVLKTDTGLLSFSSAGNTLTIPLHEKYICHINRATWTGKC